MAVGSNKLNLSKFPYLAAALDPHSPWNPQCHWTCPPIGSECSTRSVRITAHKYWYSRPSSSGRVAATSSSSRRQPHHQAVFI